MTFTCFTIADGRQVEVNAGREPQSSCCYPANKKQEMRKYAHADQLKT